MWKVPVDCSSILSLMSLNTVRKKRKGAVFIDVMIGIYILAVVGLVFAATVGASVVSRAKADELTKASAIVHRHLESIRNLGYDNLSYSALRFYNLIDSTPTEQPYQFSNSGQMVDQVSRMLRNGVGKVWIEDVSPTIKKVTVRVEWDSKSGQRTLDASTEIAHLK